MSSSPAPSTPSHFAMSEPPQSSTAASSPPPMELEEGKEESNEDLEPSEQEERLARLDFLLEKSAMYSQILKERMDANRRAEEEMENRRKRRKRDFDAGERVTEDSDAEDMDRLWFKQPALITGAQLKGYQLEGLQWMISLHSNGISGILADEMGLGKTLQTISFSAYLRELHYSKPFLVVCPLSVLHNWAEEYAKFAPEIPVCVYHGSPQERAELRRTVIAPPARNSATKPKPKPKPKPKFKAKPKARKGKGRGKKRKQDDVEEENDAGENEEQQEGGQDVDENFPVVVTTYEIIMRDRAALADYDWGYIVVDEGHRLKNLDCKLMKEIKRYKTASRMILTGTPLHNNLSELWSLLNFVLPDLFNNLDSFQEWFNLPSMQTSETTTRFSKIIDALHAILKPFLLRRLKADVETSLPPKKEYVLYAPLTETQREAYEHILDGTMRQWLLEDKDKEEAEQKKKEEVKKIIDDDGPMKLRRKNGAKRKRYDLDGDDDEYFNRLERGEVDERGVKVPEEKEDLTKLSTDFRTKLARSKVNNMKLQNTLMQLRKVCSHPFLFDWPTHPRTGEPIVSDDALVGGAGKMMVLERLLVALFERGHKVLLFSQFTTMLDVIEEWAGSCKGWKLCRIDGQTPLEERRSQMHAFQAPGSDIQLFLLSTRAGGLGINLTGADTVIFYDQDWNPQMDAQAQDRAHRIGQTKPVLIFRLLSAHTIEEKIMSKATEKRKLEALVIAQGKFKNPANATSRVKRGQSSAELAAALLRLESEKINVVPNTVEGKRSVLSDQDLDALLDRSPAVFTDRSKGWTADGHVFKVYEAPVNEGNEALARMLGEDIE